VSDLRRWRFWTEAAALGGLLIAALLILPLGRTAAREQEEPSIAPSPAPAAPAPTPEPAHVPRLDLAEAAQVCVDLARVLDGQDIPPLLARAARVLDAKGLVLWVTDSSGARLRPSLAHGYSDKVLQRLGPLQIDADNVTSLAFRSLQPQTLTDASTGAPSALAVPLITATGCIGVLAAEVQGRTGHDAVPVARMFAAQLATLVAPEEAAGAERAQA
jgi:hypothetical protein